MKLSKKIKFALLVLLITLNIVLRFQVVSQEMGWDSFAMHIMVNSLNEFGYAKWFLHPLSIFGLYPASYTSSMQFLLSGIFQSTGMEMRWVIFLYSVFIGVLSIFTAYLMAGEIIDNDIFKFLVSFGFSISPAVLGYTTWTIPTRGLLVVLAPLLVYLLLKCRISFKYIPLTFLLAMFLFATHHLFYFLIPAFIGFFILTIIFKLKNYINIIPEKLTPFALIAGFLAMYSIPFLTKRFIEFSRYASIDVSYIRYMGVLMLLAIGGLGYLIFKKNKIFGEWFLLLTLILLTLFVYEQTYMKWFLPIFLMPLAGIGLINLHKASRKRKYGLPLFTIFLLFTVSFSAYYQFIHFLLTSETNQINDRYIEESTYRTGRWMRENIVNGSAISNDETLGMRVFAVSETLHLLIPATAVDQIYRFISINMSEFKRYSITSEDFWFDGYKGPDVGLNVWESIHVLQRFPQEFNITYVVENTKSNGYIKLEWHSNYPSKLLQLAYQRDRIYDSGNLTIWKL